MSSSSSLSNIDSLSPSTPSSTSPSTQRQVTTSLTSRQRRIGKRRSPLSQRQKLRATQRLWMQNNFNIKRFLKAWVTKDIGGESGGFHSGRRIRALLSALEQTEVHTAL